ncbi:TPA: DUF2913 family protein [Citrobacter freundii]|nr:DUF2913 family protein [Citrobacter freundii]
MLLRLEYLYESCFSPIRQQSDLSRLTYAIEALKSRGWLNAVVSDDEWTIPALSEEHAGVAALLVRKSELTLNFTDEGLLLKPVTDLERHQIIGLVREATNNGSVMHRLIDRRDSSAMAD